MTRRRKTTKGTHKLPKDMRAIFSKASISEQEAFLSVINLLDEIDDPVERRGIVERLYSEILGIRGGVFVPGLFTHRHQGGGDHRTSDERDVAATDSNGNGAATTDSSGRGAEAQPPIQPSSFDPS